MALPNVGWLLEYYDLAVGGGVDTFDVEGLVSWGGIVLVTTLKESDTGFTAVEIPVSSVQSQDKYYIGPQVVSGGADEHMAEVISFYRDNASGDLMAKLKPAQTNTATYRIWFQPNRPAPPLLAQSQPLLEQFTNLLKVRAAISCLPNLYVEKIVAAKPHDNRNQIQMLGTTLQAKQAEFGAVFQKTKQMLLKPDSGPRVPFPYDDHIDDIGFR